MWGVVGALMAVPILMTLKIVCDHVESLHAVGEFVSGRAVNNNEPVNP
jgi:predicted PurR-regulated permease PerM